MSDLTSYLKQSNAKQLEADLAQLKNSYDNSLAEYTKQESDIPQTYYNANNTLAAQYAQERRNFDQRAAATGLNTGTSGQAELARSSSYMDNLGKNERQKQSELAAIALAKQQLQNTYDTNVAAAKSRAAADLQTALYNEYIRQANERSSRSSGGGGDDDETTTTKSNYTGDGGTKKSVSNIAGGNTNGGASGLYGSGTTTTKKVTSGIAGGNSSGTTSGLAKSTAATDTRALKAAAAQNSTVTSKVEKIATDVAKKTNNDKKVANTLNKYVKKGTITSSQANNIMRKLKNK